MTARAAAALALGALLLAGPAKAQSSPTEPPRTDLGSIWTVRIENDRISTQPRGSDQNYTSGVQLVWTSGPDQVPEAATRIAHFLLGDGTVRVGVALSHQFYTPANTALRTPDPRDRPYAGYVAATFSIMQDSGNSRDLLALSLGVVGPSAFGRQIQNGYHNLIGVPISYGWSHQLRDEPAVELLAQHTWRHAIGRLGPIEFDTLPSLAMGLGTVRDYLQAAFVIRVGQGLDTDFGTARIRPGISGGDAFVAADGVAWYLFAGANGQAVLHDVFLDGNMFLRSPHVTRNPFLGELEAGLAIIWRGVRLSYVQTWQTEQFRHQRPGLFNFGSLALSTRF